MSLLEIVGLTKSFGGLTANKNVDVSIESGAIVGLIGPNGAGKTTLFNCVTGYYPPDAGMVTFGGLEITGWTPEKICRAGIARTFQLVHAFADMTVWENVMVGAFLRSSRTQAAKSSAMEVIKYTGLAQKRDMLARNLTVADKKRLEVARALATGPKLLMLDEAMSGLTPLESQEAIELIRALAARGITILLVEHVMEVVMPLSHHIVVLDRGEKIADGKPEEIARNPRVIQAYLGDKFSAENKWNLGIL